MENKEGLTVLRLAATLVVPSVFRLVLELEGVYSQLDRHDGLFDSLLYDVTEIDPVARRRWRARNTAAHRRHGGVSPIYAKGLPSPPHHKVLEMGCCLGGDALPPSAVPTAGGVGGWGTGGGGGGRSASVLEIICETERVEKAFEVLNMYVVRSIVKSKWRHYRLWFLAWAVFHVLLMALLTAYAVSKATVIAASKESATRPSNLSAASEPNSTERSFVDWMSVLVMLLSVAVLVWEVVRLWRGQPLNLWLIHHNGLYRLELVVFALSLIADSIWYVTYLNPTKSA